MSSFQRVLYTWSVITVGILLGHMAWVHNPAWSTMLVVLALLTAMFEATSE